MKKLVIKTVGITLAFIVVFLAITYGVFALFFPKNTAYFYDGLGYDKIAVKYMVKAYDKSGDIKDLKTLCDYTIKTDDNGLIAEHLGEIFDKNKTEFLAETGSDYYDSASSKYVNALYEVKEDKSSCVDTAFLVTDKYRRSCAVRSLLGRVFIKNDKETALLIKTKLESFCLTASDEEKEIALSDLNVLTEFLKD